MLERFSRLNERISNNPINKVVVILLRIIVGGTFIFSGFVKCVDPIGSVYKFHDYLAALGLHNLIGSEVVLSFAIPVLELVLGVMILTGCLRYGSLFAAMGFMGVFLPLTYFLAKTNAVPDCGCFGDAVKLTNWQTFWKNVVLTIAILYLLFHNKSVPCLYGPAIQWGVMLLTFILGLSIAYMSYSTQPLLDFRPFKVGTKIGSTLSPLGENDFLYIYEKDGVQHEFCYDSIPDEDDGWEFVDRKKLTPDLSPAQKAELASFSIYDEGSDVTEEVIDTTSNQMLVLMPDFQRVNKSYAFVLNDLAKACSERDAQLCVITPALHEEVEQWKDLTSPEYPIYSGDDSEIKMLARGNPAIVYVEHGIISWKRTLSSLKTEKLLEENMPLAHLSDDFSPKKTLWQLLSPYFLLMIVLLCINRIYPVVKFIVNKVKGVNKKSNDAENIEEQENLEEQEEQENLKEEETLDNN
ncbi:MAG: DoxX family protein [Muribaculaceae bacterium]|nr:DoxX family protein [Muribaculaceae bacterium]